MTAKLLLTGLTTMAMLVVVCRVGPASWGTPATEILAKSGSPSAPEPQADRVVAEGRLVTYPGAEVVVATELAGTIVRLPVREKSTVRKGDLIAELGSDELRASRDEAVARVEEADAEARFYEREVERRRVLIARRSASDVELDTNLRGLDVSRARRRAAIAAPDRFDAIIAKTRITSPIDGAVIARFADPGETLGIAAPLVTVADLRRVRVEAEVDEIDFAGIARGGRGDRLRRGLPGADLARPGRGDPRRRRRPAAPPRGHRPPGGHPRPPRQDRPARAHAAQARATRRGADHAAEPLMPSGRARACAEDRVASRSGSESAVRGPPWWARGDRSRAPGSLERRHSAVGSTLGRAAGPSAKVGLVGIAGHITYWRASQVIRRAHSWRTARIAPQSGSSAPSSTRGRSAG